MLAVGREEHTASLLPGGHVLYRWWLGFGIREARLDRDLGSGDREFAAGPDLLQARAGHTATELPDGRILVDGRYGGPADAEVWDEASGFTAAGTAAGDLLGHIATLLADGTVLVLGGTKADLWAP
jgi:hypothetical protein